MQRHQKDLKLALKAARLGVAGAVASIFAWPFGLLALPFVLAFWVGSTGFIALHRPRYPLVTALIPNAVAAGLPLLVLQLLAVLNGGQAYQPLIGVAQYCLFAGILIALLISGPMSLTDECKPE